MRVNVQVIWSHAYIGVKNARRSYKAKWSQPVLIQPFCPRVWTGRELKDSVTMEATSRQSQYHAHSHGLYRSCLPTFTVCAQLHRTAATERMVRDRSVF